MDRVALIGGVSCLLGLAVGSAAGQACILSEPSARFCSGARQISGAPGQHVVLVDVTPGAGLTPTACGTLVGHPAWFEFTAQVSGPVTVSTCHPYTTYDTVLQVWQGGDSLCEFMAPVACNDDTQRSDCENGCSAYGSEVSFQAVAGQRYRVLVGSYNNNSAACPSLCLGLIVSIAGGSCGGSLPPTNLVCEEAREVPGSIGRWSMVTDATDALRFPSEPTPMCGLNVTKTLWFKATPDRSGLMRFSTCHPATAYDTVVQAWSSGDCQTFVALDCNDDYVGDSCAPSCPLSGTVYLSSSTTIAVTAGQTYLFQVGVYGDNQAQCPAPLCLGTWRNSSPPPALVRSI